KTCSWSVPPTIMVEEVATTLMELVSTISGSVVSCAKTLMQENMRSRSCPKIALFRVTFFMRVAMHVLYAARYTSTTSSIRFRSPGTGLFSNNIQEALFKIRQDVRIFCALGALVIGFVQFRVPLFRIRQGAFDFIQ